MSTLKTPKNIENNPKFSEDQSEDLEFTAPDLRDVITEVLTLMKFCSTTGRNSTYLIMLGFRTRV